MGVLDYLTNSASNAVNHYYDTLRVTGYKSDCSVNSILALVFLDEIYSTLGELNDDDIQVISKTIDCLQGSCDIPYEYQDTSESIPVFYI